MPPVPATGERLVELPANAAAAGLARRALTGTPGISGEVGYKALLLASELCAACVQDIEPGSQPVIWLGVKVAEDRVRIEVSGERPKPVRLAMADTETPPLGGMGLQIVERLADRWGAEGPKGSTIWFELLR